MNYETIASTIAILITSILAVLQAIETVKKNRTDKETARIGAGKTDAERQDLEDRITERVLLRAEAEMAKLKSDNDKLRSENADLLKMMRAMRMLTVKLVRKMDAAGIDPELTDEEREALYDTGKLSNFARRQK